MKTKMTDATTPDRECWDPHGQAINEAIIVKSKLVPAIIGYQRLHVVIADRGPEVQHDRFVTADLPVGGKQWSHGHYSDTLSEAEMDFSARVDAWLGRDKAQKTRVEADAMRTSLIAQREAEVNAIAAKMAPKANLEACRAALLVFTTAPRILAWLNENDPMALRQARKALGLGEEE